MVVVLSMDPKRYKNYFTSHYKLKYDELHLRLYRKWFKRQWVEVEKHISSKGANFLELGSGIGTVYSFLKDYEMKYVGLELDKEAVTFCNNYFRTRSFVNKGIEDFQSTKKFNYVFGFEVLEHVDNPSDVIAKIYNLLMSGGKFVGTSPYPFTKNVDADKTHKYVLHPSNWNKLFNNVGFKTVTTKPMSFVPYFWRIHENLNPLIPIYLPFPFFISTTLIVAQK